MTDRTMSDILDYDKVAIASLCVSNFYYAVTKADPIAHVREEMQLAYSALQSATNMESLQQLLWVYFNMRIDSVRYADDLDHVAAQWNITREQAGQMSAEGRERPGRVDFIKIAFAKAPDYYMRAEELGW